MSLYDIPITKLSGIGEKKAALFKKLGVNLTCEPQYGSNKLYHK